MKYKKTLLQMPRQLKQLLVLVADISLSLFATWLAFSFRLNKLHWPVGNEWIPYAFSVMAFIPFFIRLGLYRAVFRYSDNASFTSALKATALYSVTFFAFLMIGDFPQVPRSISLAQPIIFLGFVLVLRLFASHLLRRATLDTVILHNVLIYGAGEAGAQARVSWSNIPAHRVVGFLDDDPGKQDQKISGLMIFSPENVAEIVRRFDVTDIIIAIPSATTERRRQIINSLIDLHVRVQTLPGMIDGIRGVETFQYGEELQIIDLLHRDPIKSVLDVKAIEGHVVMVTGAGGSIGSELCRQIIKLKPALLVLIDHSEFNLYTIDEELRLFAAKTRLDAIISPCLATVRDKLRIEALFKAHRPDVVFHAAAYKHVPLVEGNRFEAAENNVIGTKIMAEAAQRHRVSRFTLISTDKAVRPTNFMGASKRLAEQIIQALAALPKQKTIFSIVRFGNVLDSSGSVVPLFRRQIAIGGPVTITHPDAVRYFMTIPEAVGLVLQASQLASGGEVFVLDMGEPVKILDLAKRMIRLSGFSERTSANPSGEIEIVTIGLRPGEKLFEELLIGDNAEETANPNIMKAYEEFMPWEVLTKEIEALQKAVVDEDDDALEKILPRIPA